MNKNYEKLIDGIDMMGEALIEIGKNAENKPLKLIVSKLIEKLGFNDTSIGDDIAMIRFAVTNDDESLEKLTAQVTSGVVYAEPEVKEDKPEVKEDKPEVKEDKPEVKKDAAATTVSGE